MLRGASSSSHIISTHWHSQKHLKDFRQRVMGSEAKVDEQHSKIPQLPLFSILPMKSPERSGMLTPPLHASASVPFHWEQEPGKPRPCTALVTFSNNNNLPKCLELPPRLLLPSPTTVLEGPYVEASSSNRFQAPSFRMSTEEGVLGSMVLTNGGGMEDKGWWFCSGRKKAFKVKRDLSGGNHVFPSSVDRESGTIGVGGTHKKVHISKMKHSGSFSNLSHGKSHLWTTIIEGLKQVVPSWRSKKLKNEESGIRL